MDMARALSGGDRRSIGRATAVVSHILRHRETLGELIEALEHEDPIVRMRAADVAEKISKQHPDWLRPYAQRFVALAGNSTQQEIRWHLAQMLPRLRLSPSQRRRALAALLGYLDDQSRIVQVSALTALVEFSCRDPGLKSRVAPLVARAVRSGTPSLRARAKKLLAQLRQNSR